MKLCIDIADVAAIKRLYELYPCDGVSTNPSILAKSGRNPYDVLKEIRSIIGPEGELFVQAVSKDAEQMVVEAKRIVAELGANTVVKITCTPQGYKAMRMCKELGIRTLGTAIYTPMQGYLAAKAGACYVAPYVNRIDNMGFNGIEVAKEIHDIITASGYDCSLLAASFKNSQQVLELAKYGCGAVTVGPDVIDAFVKNAAIDSAIDAFVSDFEGLTGKGIDMSNC